MQPQLISSEANRMFVKRKQTLYANAPKRTPQQL